MLVSFAPRVKLRLPLSIQVFSEAFYCLTRQHSLLQRGWETVLPDQSPTQSSKEEHCCAVFSPDSQAIEDRGYRVVPVDVSEFQKLDGGLSCLSLRF